MLGQALVFGFGFWVLGFGCSSVRMPGNVGHSRLKTQNSKPKTQIENRSRRSGACVFIVGNLWIHLTNSSNSCDFLPFLPTVDSRATSMPVQSGSPPGSRRWGFRRRNFLRQGTRL